MKKLLSLILASAMLLSLTACASSSTSDTSQGTTSTNKDLVVAFQADATHMDPHIASNGISNTISYTMYETLYYFNGDMELTPLLAESYTVSDDALTYTFKLREGVYFTDGEPFNADAFIANYQRGVDDSTLSLNRSTANWEKVEALNDYEVAITLTSPNNTFINKITQIRIASPKAIEQGKDYLAKNSAGTGAYILEERVDGAYTKLVPNPDYWNGKPDVDSLTFKVVPEDASRVAMLKTGEAHIIHPLPTLSIGEIESDSSMTVNNLAGSTYRYVTLNTQLTLADGSKPLSDVRVRQAFNYAFDNDAYTQVVFNGAARVPTSLFSSAVMYHSPQKPYTKDLEKAKALMAEAGYADGFDLTIVCDNTTIEQMGAEFVKQQLAEINVNVELLPNESTANAEITSAPLEETKLNMWYVNWGAGSFDADGSLRRLLHSSYFPPSGYNTAFWANEKFDQLIDDALIATDTKEIADLYAQAQALAWEECPWIFLGNDNTVNAYRNEVSGIQYKPGGDIIFRTASMS